MTDNKTFALLKSFLDQWVKEGRAIMLIPYHSGCWADGDSRFDVSNDRMEEWFNTTGFKPTRVKYDDYYTCFVFEDDIQCKLFKMAFDL